MDRVEYIYKTSREDIHVDLNAINDGKRVTEPAYFGCEYAEIGFSAYSHPKETRSPFAFAFRSAYEKTFLLFFCMRIKMFNFSFGKMILTMTMDYNIQYTREYLQCWKHRSKDFIICAMCIVIGWTGFELIEFPLFWRCK